jgi:CHAT domain-containing protein/Flp pilus assembly protein TadD
MTLRVAVTIGLALASLAASGEERSAQALYDRGRELRVEGTRTSLAQAIDSFEEALRLFQAAGDGTGSGDALFQLGMCRYALGDHSGALDAYERALPLRRATGDGERLAQTLNNLGILYDFLGEDQKALDYYRQAIEMRKQSGSGASLAAPLTNIGLIYAAHGEYELALAYHRQALEEVRKASNPASEARTLHNIGQVYAARGQDRKALEVFRAALALRRKAGDRRGEAHTLNSLATTYAALGLRSKALDLYGNALEIKRERGDRVSEAFTLQDLGSLYRALGDRVRARQSYGQALTIRREVRQADGEAATLASIAQLDLDEKDVDSARRNIESAIAIIESLRSNLPAPASRSSYFATKASYYSFYIEVLMQLHIRDRTAHYDRVAFEVSERARARTLLETLGESPRQIRSLADPVLLERQETLRRRIISAERQRRDSDELNRLLAEAQEVDGMIRAQSPRYSALTAPAPVSLTEIQQSVVDESTVLLEFALGAKRSVLWMVTPQTITSFELPPSQVIDRAARRARGLLIASAKRTHRHSAEVAMAELQTLVLGPVLPRLGNKRLLVVADGSLQWIPFGALGGTKPLIERHEIVTAPSASVIAVLRREFAGRHAAPKSIAVFGDPLTGRSLPKLSAARREATMIASMAPAHDALLAFGTGASADLATSEDIGNYRILHFATHATIDDVHPELSSIVLAGRDLQMTDIYNLRIGADLVVLSACDTAAGKEVRGEGLISLVRGFMYAGASRVVATLWRVHDEAAEQLMREFYRALLVRRVTPVAALREAQLALKRDGRFNTPADWAAFTVQGEWR